VAAVLAATAAIEALAVPGTDPASAARAPAISAKSDEPQREAQSFGMPKGFVVDLFASEPDVANPVAFSIDEQGRVFVCESFRQNHGVTDNRNHNATWVDADLAAQSVEDRRDYHLKLLGDKAANYEIEDDRVRLLTDTDGDGHADTATVFADGFNRIIDGTAAGILARHGDVFLACIPGLYRLRDSSGDGRTDASAAERTVLSSGYGVRVALRGHDLHGLVMGHDGRLYFTIGDRGYRVEHDGVVDHDPGSGAVFRCLPDGSGLEVFARSLRNPQELAFDDLGNLFTVDNNSDAGDRARLVHLVPGGETGWNMAYQYLSDRGPWQREKIWQTACDGQPAWCLPALAYIGAGPAGFAAYPGTGLPPHFDGRFLLADFRGGAAGSSVRTFRLRPKGASFEPYDEEETFKNILATDVEVGPDGAVWVSDWVHGWNGEGKGRIWRFHPQQQNAAVIAEVRSLLSGDWMAVPVVRLQELLGHADRRLRLEAQWELARRGDAVPLVDVLRDTARPVLARVHAVWGLEQVARARGAEIAAVVVPQLVEASGDEAWELRLVAARSLGELSGGLLAVAGPNRGAARVALAARLADSHLHVRAAAATALGQMGHCDGDDVAAAAALVTLAAADIESDAYLRHAIVMGIAGTLPRDAVHALARHETANVRLAACLAMRRLRDDSITVCLADPSPRVVLEAARAIHDLPLPAALPALASRAADGPADEAFMRRAISAAERMGTSAAADQIVAVIGRGDISNAMRLEAVAALHDWPAPPMKNRVTGVWQPHAATRDVAAAQAALRAEFSTLAGAADGESAPRPKLDESVRSALLGAASALGIGEVSPLLVSWCSDASCSPASRARALEALVAAKDPAVVGIAARLVKDKSSVVRTAAMQVRVARLPAAEIVPELLAAVLSSDASERQAAVRLLGEIDSPEAVDAVTSLVDDLKAGRLDTAIELEVNEAAAARLGEETASALATARSVGGDADSAWPAALRSWHDCLEGGDAARGREIFLNKTVVACVRCHGVNGTGGEVGPKLDGIAGKRDHRHMLEALVLPDAQIAEGYGTTVIVTDEGRSVAGIVIAENGTVVKLRSADGKIEEIDVASIEDRARGPSAMPADLVTKLSRRELRDLIAWLASLR